MSSAPSNGKTGTTAAARGRTGSIDKPAAKPAAKPKPKEMTPEQKKIWLIGSVAVAVVLGMGALIFAYFHKPGPETGTRLNAPVQNLVAYMSTGEFDKLDFDRKKLYIKEIAGKKKEIEQLFDSQKITEAQFKEVLSLAWIGKQFKHVEKYNSLGNLDRIEMLDEIIIENIKDKAWEKEHPKPPGYPTKDPKRIKAIEQTFPSYDRDQISRFRQALNEREKVIKHEDRNIGKEGRANAAHATTRPTARPLSTGPTTKPAVITPHK